MGTKDIKFQAKKYFKLVQIILDIAKIEFSLINLALIWQTIFGLVQINFLPIEDIKEPIYFFGSLGKILMDLNTDNFLLASPSQEHTTYNNPNFDF